MVVLGAAMMLAKKGLKSKSLKKLSKGVFKGGKRKGRKKSAAWYAKETQRLKYKARYQRAKMRSVW